MKKVSLRRRSVIMAVAICPILACSDTSPSMPSAVRNVGAEERPSAAWDAVHVRPTDAKPLALSDSIPEFGGYYLGPGGRVHVLLTNTTSLSTAQPLIERHVRNAFSAITTSAGFEVDPARFSFRQLVHRRDILFHEGFSAVRGMHGLGIDRKFNRISVDVVGQFSADQVTELMRRLGIPSEAVHIEQRAEEKDFALLTDLVVPAAGGLRIWNEQRNAICSIGFNVENGTKFITASHCTRVIGPDAPQLQAIYQPNALGAYVGTESFDAPTFDDSTGVYECPAFQQCRWSDAALIAYPINNQPGGSGMGKIYRTDYRGSYGAGSLNIVTSLSITGEISAPQADEVLDKIGSSTGWTSGTVSNVCKDVRSIETGIYFLCQVQVVATASGGDSGAPVFRLGSDGTATAVGIVRGGDNVNYTFSPLGQIWSELGYFSTYVH